MFFQKTIHKVNIIDLKKIRLYKVSSKVTTYVRKSFYSKILKLEKVSHLSKKKWKGANLSKCTEALKSRKSLYDARPMGEKIIRKNTKEQNLLSYGISKLGSPGPSVRVLVWLAFNQWEHRISLFWPIRTSKRSLTTNANRGAWGSKS